MSFFPSNDRLHGESFSDQVIVQSSLAESDLFCLHCTVTSLSERLNAADVRQSGQFCPTMIQGSVCLVGLVKDRRVLILSIHSRHVLTPSIPSKAKL